MVSLRRRCGRRRDTGGIGHAPDGAQEAEVRGLADHRGQQRGLRKATLVFRIQGFLRALESVCAARHGATELNSGDEQPDRIDGTIALWANCAARFVVGTDALGLRGSLCVCDVRDVGGIPRQELLLGAVSFAVLCAGDMG